MNEQKRTMAMPKRLIAWVLTLIMILGMLPTNLAVPAAAESQAAVGITDGVMWHCLCGNHFKDADGNECYRTKAEDCLSYTDAEGKKSGCDGTLVQWTAWDAANQLPATGNYYLTGNITPTAAYYIKLNRQVALDLNGHTITDKLTRIFTVEAGNSFTLTDSSAAKSGNVTMDSATTFGWGGIVCNKGEFTMYGGTLNANKCNSNDGGVVRNDGGTFHMYGGTVKNGSNATVGGNVYLLNAANANIYGGTVENGASANGGNFYVNTGTTLRIYGGTIQGGTTTNRGGNIYATNGAVEIYGGTVKNGVATGWADNVYSIKSPVTITGGSIETNNPGKKNSNLLLQEATANISGGSINGCIAAVTFATVNLSGDPVIYAPNGSYSLDTNAMTVNVTGAMTEGAKIAISNVASGAVATGSGYTLTQQDARAFAYAGHGLVDATVSDNSVVLGGYRCACLGNASGKGDHVCNANVTWTAWTSDTTLPTAEGNYYLTKNVTVTGPSTISAEGADVVLDLNGKTVTASGNTRNYVLTGANASLSITDSVGTGKIIRSSSDSGLPFASMIWNNNATGTVNLYGGVIDGNKVSSTANAMIITNGAFNIYGGTIRNGRGGNFGGNIYVENGKLDIYGGCVEDGYTSHRGGNISVNAGAVLNLHGGRIIGGDSGNWGGNIYALGATVNMTGGEVGEPVIGATANAHENISLHKTILNMSAGYISGYVDMVETSTANLSGSAKIYGGSTNLQAKPEATIKVVGALNKDAKIGLSGSNGAVAVQSSDTYTLQASDAVYFTPDLATQQLELRDGSFYLKYTPEGCRWGCVCGGKAAGIGDHVCTEILWEPWSDATSLPTEEGYWYLTGPVEVNTHASMLADTNVALDLNGQTVSVKGDARVYRFLDVSGATLSITDSVGGGKIIRVDDANAGHGGMIWMAATGNTFNLYGGTLDGNHYVAGNGAVVLSQGTFNMYGGTIQNGNSASTDSHDGGGNIRVQSGSFNLYGGTVSGGYATQRGGNINVNSGATVNIKGGSITGGDSGNWGGNIYALGATINMTAGQVDTPVIGATATNNENICLFKATLNMSGGYISGYVSLVEKCAVNLSGSAKIYGGATNLRAESASAIKVTDQLSEDARIGLSGSNGVLAISGSDTYTLKPSDKVHFVPDLATQKLSMRNGGFYLEYTPEGHRWGCVCGGNVAGHACEDVLWQVWDGSEGVLPSNSGYYYLTDDVVCTQVNGIVKNNHVVIDLNGHTITASEANRLYLLLQEGGQLTITDSVGGGTVRHNEAIEELVAHGGLFLIGSGCTMNIYGGSFDGGNAANSGNGGVLSCNGTLNIYGGTVTNGNGFGGGNIRVGNGGEVNIYGGTVTDGTATEAGDDIYVDHYAVLNVYGGHIGKIYANIDGEIGLDKAVSVEHIYLDQGVLRLGEEFTVAQPIPLDIRKAGLVAYAAVDYSSCFANETYSFVYNNAGQLWCGAEAAILSAGGKITDCDDLQTAVNAAQENQVVRMQSNFNGQLNVSKNVCIDLNGFVLAGTVTVAESLNVIDSTTADFDAANGCGKLTAQITGQLTQLVTAPEAVYGAKHQYLAVPGEEGYSFHRVELAIENVRLNAAESGFTYDVVFKADETVIALITQYGSVCGSQNHSFQLPAAWDGVNDNRNTVNVFGLTPDCFADTVDLTARIVVGDQEVTTAAVTVGMKQLLLEAEENFHNLSDAEKMDIYALYDSEIMGQWNLINIANYGALATVEIAGMDIVYDDTYGERVSDTTIKALLDAAAWIGEKTGVTPSVEAGTDTTGIFVRINEALAENTFSVNVSANGIVLVGSNQKAAYYAVEYFVKSLLHAPSALANAAAGTYMIPAVSFNKTVTEQTIDQLAENGNVVVLTEKVATIPGEPDYASPQAVCYDGTYAYMTFVDFPTEADPDAGVRIVKFTIEGDTWQKVTSADFAYEQLCHANDMTCKDGKLYITQVNDADRRYIAIVDAATLTLEDTVLLDGNGSERTYGIHYNEERDLFLAATLNDGTAIYDSAFNYLVLMPRVYHTGLTPQSILSDDDHIYQLLWNESADMAGVSQLQTLNYLQVQNWNGDLIAQADIWLNYDLVYGDNHPNHMEAKNFFMKDGELYGIFLEWGKGMTVYKLDLVRAIDATATAMASSHSWGLTLADDIGMNFRLQIREDVKANATVTVTVAGKSQTVALGEAVDGLYTVPVHVAAAQMTDTVTLEVKVDGLNLIRKDYTVRQYADVILSGDYSKQTKALVTEMLGFGAAAQTYFGHGGAAADAGIDGFANAEIPAVAEQEMAVSGEVAGIRFYAASLVYRSATAVRIYFKADDISGYTFTANGSEVEAQAGKDMWYIEVADINPQDLKNQVNVTVTDGTDTLSVSYGPMNYIVRMNLKGSDELKALLKALYNYHNAAVSYVNS